jgi:ketosteroid isomerase-like protein
MKDFINTFYTVFAKGDAETMTSCYHKEVVFKDPSFGELSR